MPASVSSPRVGVRLIGARGSVATTVEGEVRIDDAPALGDGKTAWDPIAFDGCRGTRTVLQTIWQGCDSSLGERHAALVGFARRAATPRTGAASGDTPGGGGAWTGGRTEARPGDRPGEGAVRTERLGEER